MKITLSRRFFLKTAALLLGCFFLKLKPQAAWSKLSSKDNLGISKDGLSHIYIATGGSPEENTNKVIELMGKIEKIINPDDIVILKPNSQWWNQGMTNTNSMKEFISQILNMPGFKGEIIIADNHQFQQDESRGWTTDTPNGDLNLNQLIAYFNNAGHNNVTKYHWHCAGPNAGLV